MRFPECFPEVERVQQLQSELGKAISDSLTMSKLKVNAKIDRGHQQEVDLQEMKKLLE